MIALEQPRLAPPPVRGGSPKAKRLAAQCR